MNAKGCLNRAARGVFTAVGLCLLAATVAAQSAAYTNPVLAGDYPDPSIIRVGPDYWATATSSQ